MLLGLIKWLINSKTLQPLFRRSAMKLRCFDIRDKDYNASKHYSMAFYTDEKVVMTIRPLSALSKKGTLTFICDLSRKEPGLLCFNATDHEGVIGTLCVRYDESEIKISVSYIDPETDIAVAEFKYDTDRVQNRRHGALVHFFESYYLCQTPA